MAMVRFATTCDTCGTRSEEYTAWPTCEICLNHICAACYVWDSYVSGEGEGPDMCVCKKCERERS